MGQDCHAAVLLLHQGHCHWRSLRLFRSFQRMCQARSSTCRELLIIFSTMQSENFPFFGKTQPCLIQMEKCLCRHNTCGENCDMCCPLYNQYPWGPGNSTASAMCEKCQCYGHADACVYDPEVNQRGQSLSIFGHYAGGGVCLECKVILIHIA